MDQLLRFLTSPAGASLLAILASVVGLIVRRWSPSDTGTVALEHSQANTAIVSGDRNVTIQTNHKEEHTHVNSSGGQASNSDELDDLAFRLAAVLVLAALALIGFAYANRLTPVIVGLLALFVTFASRSWPISLMNGLLAAVSFAGYLSWAQIEYGDASLKEVEGLKESRVDVLFHWFDLSSDQRLLFGTALAVSLAGLVITSLTAAMLLKERATGQEPRSVNGWPLAAATGVVVVGMALTWVGVLPGLVQRVSTSIRRDSPAASSVVSSEPAWSACTTKRNRGV